MAEETLIMDNPEAPRSDPIEPPIEGDGNGEEEEFVLGKHKFKSIDAAGGAYEEIVAAHNQKSERLNALQAEIDNLKGQAQLAGAIDKLAQASAAPGKKELSFDEFTAQLETVYAEDPVKALKMAMQVNHDWRQEDVKGFKSELQQERDRLLAEIHTLKSGQEKLNPDYQAYKADVDRLTAKGMKVEDAIVFAKEISALRGQTDRELPPGNLNGPARTIPQSPSSQATKYFQTEDQWLQFAMDAEIEPYGEVGKRQRAGIEADYSRNINKNVDLKEFTG